MTSEEETSQDPDDAVTPRISGSERSPSIGEVLAGRYEIVRKLGSGGMGEVFEAHDLKDHGLRVAVKRLFDTTPKGFVRFKREYRRMEAIGHPNLLALFGLEVHDGQPFIVMEYVDGVLFYEALTGANNIVDMERLRSLTRQLTLGVLELHEQGRVHRDLKGLNVLVSTQGRVVILDFGLVNEIERRTLFTTSPARVEGTAKYMAPEQFYGNATPASDWYAVGVMLYRAVTGQYPYPEAYPEIMYAKDERAAPRARVLVADLPPELDDLIARLLERAMDLRANGLDLLAWCDRREYVAPPRPTAARSSSALLGREPQLALLAAARARFMTRVPLRVDITGASGTGKTALMRRFLAPLRDDPEWVVLEGRCYEHDSVPFKAFDGVIDSLGRYLRWLPREQAEPLLGEGFRVLCRLFPTLRQGRDATGAGGVLRGLGLDRPEYEPQELRHRAVVALRSLLHRIAAGSRLVLAVDDLQWGDVDSARLLSELMAPPGAPPLLFVCTYRSEDADQSPFLRELATLQATSSRSGEAVVIPVEALTMGPATVLAQQLLGDITTAGRARAEAIAREVQGNPMLLKALVHFLGERRDVAPASLNAGTVLSLDQLVARQLVRLDADASRLLDVIAVTGQPTRLDMLEKAAALTGDPRAVAAQLRVNSLVRTTHVGDVDLLEIYHQRISRVVLMRLSSAELRERHRKVAMTLAETGGDPARLAYHWFSCGELDQAAEAALDAGMNALRIGAFERACTLFRLAVTCRPQALEAQRKLAEALVTSGRLTEAAPMLLALAERTTRPSRAEQLRREAGEYYMISGELRRGLEVLQPLLQAAELVYPEGEAVARRQHSEAFAQLVRRGFVWIERSELELPSSELARHDLWWTLCKGHMLNDIVRGGLFAAQSALLALELGEPRRICRSLAVAGAVGLERGREEGRQWLNEADRIAQKIRDRHAMGLVAICWALVRRGRGEWAQALADLDYGLPRLAVGAAWEHSMASGSLLSSLEALGELSRLALQSQRLAQAAQDLGSKRMYCLALTFSVSAALAADDLTRCHQRVAELNTMLAGDEYQMVHLYALKVAVDLNLYQGDAVGAWRRVLEQWPSIERSRLLSTGMRRFVALSLRARTGVALLASGAPGYEHLPELIEEDISQVEKEPAVHALPVAHILRAGLAALRGSPDVNSYLDVAAADFETAGMVLHAACARYMRAGRSGFHTARPEMAHATRVLRMQGVAQPERWTTVLAPGLAPSAR